MYNEVKCNAKEGRIDIPCIPQCIRLLHFFHVLLLRVTLLHRGNDAVQYPIQLKLHV